MHFSTLFLLATTALAALNEPCYGPNSLAGVCLTNTACTSSGGTTSSGGCPSDPANVLCCSKPACKGAGTTCGWKSDCAGTSTAGLCPGPAQMACCSSTQNGWGGYAAPTFPAVGGCKAVAVEGAKKVVARFPGRVREIGCTRGCECSATPSSDHCCGKAIDYMIADGGGQATLSGAEIAEWIMNNQSVLKLKYVIWGQKIWSPGRDAVGPWKGWRKMESRGDLTQNHWDHVHASFN